MNTKMAIQKIRRIFQDNCFERRTLSTKGKIEFGRLPMHKTSKMLFSQPTERQRRKYSMEILIDRSGSMYKDSPGIFGSFQTENTPGQLANEAGKQMANTLGKYCDLNIVLFNYLETQIKWKEFQPDQFKDIEDAQEAVEVINSEGKRIIVSASKAESYSQKEEAIHSYGGNWDPINVMNSYSRLKKKSGKKIMLVLLDGTPNLDHHGGPRPSPELEVSGWKVGLFKEENYRKMVEKLSKEMKIIAFGIKTNDPAKYFPNFYQINTADEILDTLVQALTDHVTS